MALEKSFYRCEVCGNLVELIEDGGGELVCCGEWGEVSVTHAAGYLTREGNPLMP